MAMSGHCLPLHVSVLFASRPSLHHYFDNNFHHPLVAIQLVSELEVSEAGKFSPLSHTAHPS